MFLYLFVQVLEVLQEVGAPLGLTASSEQPTQDDYFIVDILLTPNGGSGSSGSGAAGVSPIAVEVDGPSHYAVNRPQHMMGFTALRDRLLSARYSLICVPHFEWNALPTRNDKRAYLRDKVMRVMKAAAAVASAAAPQRPAVQLATAVPWQQRKQPLAAAGGRSAGRTVLRASASRAPASSAAAAVAVHDDGPDGSGASTTSASSAADNEGAATTVGSSATQGPRGLGPSGAERTRQVGTTRRLPASKARRRSSGDEQLPSSPAGDQLP